MCQTQLVVANELIINAWKAFWIRNLNGLHHYKHILGFEMQRMATAIKQGRRIIYSDLISGKDVLERILIKSTFINSQELKNIGRILMALNLRSSAALINALNAYLRHIIWNRLTLLCITYLRIWNVNNHKKHFFLNISKYGNDKYFEIFTLFQVTYLGHKQNMQTFNLR